MISYLKGALYKLIDRLFSILPQLLKLGIASMPSAHENCRTLLRSTQIPIFSD